MKSKSDPETVSGTGSPPEVNKFFRFVYLRPIIITRYSKMHSIQTEWENERQFRRVRTTFAMAEVIIAYTTVRPNRHRVHSTHWQLGNFLLLCISKQHRASRGFSATAGFLVLLPRVELNGLGRFTGWEVSHCSTSTSCQHTKSFCVHDLYVGRSPGREDKVFFKCLSNAI